ncbi:iron-containing redox enzyme family protein [Streptomyces sp. ACA25]|uniref:iron-containing redox enzyme family protein n=1 Tax=Streptomyces sp. ACA25 TaxID=3022596 RepID=UPI002307B04D|nr:iron-containing redox enzyme family protein [Streptomyces sp. ACA25]MDB1090066.1 iron-containing redox enzyme family protein [Streptomyces sp. ACA25]
MTAVTAASTAPGPPGAATLPEPRGPLSAAVCSVLAGELSATALPPETAEGADPYGEDLQLALYTCYELHYQGFRDVDPEWEWDLGLLRLRAGMERRFLEALRGDVPGGDDVTAELGQLLTEPVDGGGPSHHLAEGGTWWEMREYLAHRSVYHLKEADPHAWVIPRLSGQAKAALVAVEFDEFGGGRAERAHSRLFADLLSGAGLDPEYLTYLDIVPAPALSLVNLMSLCGLHRSLRGALVGHFAAAEITTAPSARRMAKALERLEAPPQCVFFYTEHIEADAVHEQVMRHEVLGDLLRREPGLAPDVVFGIQATELLEARLADRLMHAWQQGGSSLRRPLSGPAAGR